VGMVEERERPRGWYKRVRRERRERRGRGSGGGMREMNTILPN
jgi:hypothetical protein